MTELATGRPSVATVRKLTQAQRSKQRLLLEAVRRGCPAAEPAFTLLAEVEHTEPRLVAKLLDLPQLGLWAVEGLARLRRGETPDPGYLNAVAAVAAIRAHRPCDLPGDPLLLPGVGRWADGRWTPVPRLTLAGDGLELRLAVDALDPRFAVFGDRLTPGPAELETLRARLAEAWHLLVRLDRRAAAALAAGVRTLVPLREPGAGASSGWAWGTVALYVPPDPVRLAEALLHEFQHLVLGAVDDLAPLTSPADTSRRYVPWRADPRPVAGVLQGCYAFLAVTAFWRRIVRTGPPPGRRQEAETEYARWREATHATAEALAEGPGLTPAGEQFARGIARRIRPWLAEPLPPESVRQAETLRHAHHERWRLTQE
ncbi:HEXXH motif-containing putative peptide modification protein [Nonomuraea sp. NPDC050310]|uniref:aKG-HExxH-type peptide beta-hydroxylase n=1 Tax=Nonomuraea sp. NPDC050310 TaxID=3154935 RepID=UPI0033D674C5